MAVPRIICGPIIRRVTNRKVSIWLACSRNRGLTLKLYEGDNIKVKADSTHVSIPDGSVIEVATTSTPRAVTARFGQNLWIAVVTAETVQPLQVNRTYSYNIILDDHDNPTSAGEDFRTEGLLKDGTHEGRPQKAIGYGTNLLPTFVLPADDPADLFIAHASCRKMHGHGLDALAHLDGIIKKAVTKTTVNPFGRPAQLFLTGDQIYGDDVPGMLLDNLGVNEGETLVGQEQVKIRQENSTTDVDVDADKISFPPFFRKHLISTYSGLSAGLSNHLISFEEYAGTYLNYWSVRSWQKSFYDEIKKVIDDNKKSVAEGVADRFLDRMEGPERFGLIKILEADRGNAAPFVFNEAFNKEFKKEYGAEFSNALSNQTGDPFKKWKKYIKKKVAKEVKEMAKFAKSLPTVSRVLANTPTYMIFDDHEVTDDWNLSKRWQNLVMSKPLGRDIVRNALMAYVVFQDWGNTPDDYVVIQPSGGDTSPITKKTELLRKITDYGHSIATSFQLNQLRSNIIAPIENLLGMSGSPSEIKWHFEVDTGPTKTFVLDTRMNRHFASLNSPPGLTKKSVIEDAIPSTKPFGNAPFTFVVSAAPVFALQSFEELIQPAAASVIGITATSGPNPGILEGRIKFDFESWGFNTEALENLIQRMVKLEKVIILSGDVHYGFSSVLDYWEGSSTTPKARVVQLTSSSLKNESFGFEHLYRSALAEKVLTGIGDKLEKLVWKNKVLSVSGNVTVRNRSRLRKNPAVLPTAGWQAGATVSQAPDYRYRITVQTDESVRSDDLVTADINLSDPNSVKEGYKKVVQRSLATFISGVHRRMVWPSNVGLIKFEADGSDWKVKHEFLFMRGDRDISKQKVDKHIKHTIPLVASGSETNRPELP